jgi:hypothetical protein
MVCDGRFLERGVYEVIVWVISFDSQALPLRFNYPFCSDYAAFIDGPLLPRYLLSAE